MQAASFSSFFGKHLVSGPNQGASAWQLPPKMPKVHLSLCLLGALSWTLEVLGAHPPSYPGLTEEDSLVET